MTKVIRTALAITMTALLSVALVESPAQAAGPLASCFGHINNPHFSSGSGGVIVKARVGCDADGVDEYYLDLTLFYCGDRYPTATESWVNNNCSRAGNNVDTIFNPVGGKTYTRYAPKVGDPASNRRGYYIGCLFWEAKNNDNVRGDIVFSGVLYHTP